MISITNIQKEYRGRRVLNIEYFEFEQGKKYALLGANGSGKSTLLKIMAGVVKQSAGTVEIGFKDKRDLGYLPQSPYGFSFSVLKNVLIAVDKKCGRDVRRRKAINAINEVGMDKLIKADASKLSGGETQRMAFARIISMSRKLLLLDEPTAAADLGGIDLLEQALLRYCQGNAECTVIFATHSPAQVVRLADRIIFLHQGNLVEESSASEFLESPKSSPAQAFMKHWRI